MAEEVTVFEYMWRNCYQIVCWEQERSAELFPDVFGCGFMLQNKDSYIFVTADHVVHKKDWDEGIRTGQLYIRALVNNYNQEENGGIETVLSEMPDFSYCDRYNLKSLLDGKEDVEVAMIPEMIDISYCKIKPPFKYPLLTNELRVENDVLCKGGMEKLCLTPESFAMVDPGKEYFILGTLGNKLDDIRWNRVNALHTNFRYVDEKDDMIRFSYTDFVSNEEWEGLSGSPVFSCDGELVGMVVRVVEGNSTLWVYPINYIMKVIQKIESLP